MQIMSANAIVPINRCNKLTRRNFGIHIPFIHSFSTFKKLTHPDMLINHGSVRLMMPKCEEEFTAVALDVYGCMIKKIAIK